MKSLLLVLALGLLAVWAADAQLVSNALGSHMVLQRVRPPSAGCVRSR
jgi:hypothetical protein